MFDPARILVGAAVVLLAAAPAAAQPAKPGPATPATPPAAAASTQAPMAPSQVAPALASDMPTFTIDQAVGIALQRNRDVIAAKLDIQAARVDRIAAGLYWNPELTAIAG